MIIVCRDCGRTRTEREVPYHLVCDCKKTLISFGEQLNCEIICFEKKKPGKIPMEKRLNLYKANEREKINYFQEKYPKKQ